MTATEGRVRAPLPPTLGKPAPAGVPVRILICDDHAVVREGLRALLDRPDMRVVAEAETAADAVDAAAREAPDVVIMDVQLPDGSGVEACRSIRETLPETKVVMLTAYPNDEALYASLVAGAAAYILKQVRARALVQTIEAVAHGRNMLDPEATAAALDRIRRGVAGADPALSSITDQERHVLEQLATGKSNREIAEALYLSDKTVKNYVSRILEKLDLRRRAEAAAFATRRQMGCP